MKYLVLGLGKTGKSVCDYLERNQIPFTTYDDKIHTTYPSLNDIDAIIKSPGIFPNHPLLQNNLLKISDLHLFKTNACIIAITGTNGKTTLTHLIAHILRCCGKNVEMGANMGTPVLDLPKLTAQDFCILELSSFQLELKPDFAIDTAILLNITADHIDFHGSMEHYTSAKLNIFEYAKHKLSCIPIGDGIQHVTYSQIIEHIQKTYDLDPQMVKDALASFKSLPYRLEQFAQKDKTIFIDDSKATNFDSVCHGLEIIFEKFPKAQLHIIVGGRFKSFDMNTLLDYLKKAKHIYIIGEACNNDTFKKIQNATVCFNMENALKMMKENLDTMQENIVLLCPGGSSLDQYRNFEERGKHFKQLVQQLFF